MHLHGKNTKYIDVDQNIDIVSRIILHGQTLRPCRCGTDSSKCGQTVECCQEILKVVILCNPLKKGHYEVLLSWLGARPNIARQLELCCANICLRVCTVQGAYSKHGLVIEHLSSAVVKECAFSHLAIRQFSLESYFALCICCNKWREFLTKAVLYIAAEKFTSNFWILCVLVHLNLSWHLM